MIRSCEIFYLTVSGLIPIIWGWVFLLFNHSTPYPEHWPNLEQVLSFYHGNPNHSAGIPVLLHILLLINHPCIYILSSAIVPGEKLHAAAMLALIPVFGM